MKIITRTTQPADAPITMGKMEEEEEEEESGLFAPEPVAVAMELEDDEKLANVEDITDERVEDINGVVVGGGKVVDQPKHSGTALHK